MSHVAWEPSSWGARSATGGMSPVASALARGRTQTSHFLSSIDSAWHHQRSVRRESGRGAL